MSASTFQLSDSRLRKECVPRRPPALRDVCILFLVTLLTRVPFLGVAEPDSALFVTGARQWLRGGPGNLSIYSSQVCALYYATVAVLIRRLHLGEQSCVLLMSSLSLVACLGIVAFGYLLCVRFAGPRAALGAMLLFTLSPGLWWITMEPHPQAVSLCFGLAAIWAFCRYLDSSRVGFLLLSIASFAVAMAMKNDAILLTPALLAVVLYVRATWRNAAMVVVVTGCAGGLCLALARVALGPAAHSVATGQQALSMFARMPTLVDLVRDGAPIVFGIGLITAVVLAGALAYALTKDPDRRRWALVLACWSLPGYAFWLCISGNDVRHVVAFGIPLFWLGAKYLRMRYVVACLCISLLLPANSNMFMFPSPNVPGSSQLFAQKEQEMGAMADLLATQQSCFIGSYTNDYLVNALLDRGGRVESQLSDLDVSSRSVRMPNGNVILFDRIGTSLQPVAMHSCRSLERNQMGQKVRFLGAEWHIPLV